MLAQHFLLHSSCPHKASYCSVMHIYRDPSSTLTLLSTMHIFPYATTAPMHKKNKCWRVNMSTLLSCTSLHQKDIITEMVSFWYPKLFFVVCLFILGFVFKWYIISCLFLIQKFVWNNAKHEIQLLYLRHQIKPYVKCIMAKKIKMICQIEFELKSDP